MAQTDAERMRAYRERQNLEAERKRLEELDRGMPWQGLCGEEREARIRDFYGYSSSETRTQAERLAAAERMRAHA